MPSSTITAISKANAGSYASRFGTGMASTWLLPSWCCKPSPDSVVRPDVPPSKNPRVRMSAAAQIKSAMRWNPNIE